MQFQDLIVYCAATTLVVVVAATVIQRVLGQWNTDTSSSSSSSTSSSSSLSELLLHGSTSEIFAYMKQLPMANQIFLQTPFDVLATLNFVAIHGHIVSPSKQLNRLEFVLTQINKINSFIEFINKLKNTPFDPTSSDEQLLSDLWAAMKPDVRLSARKSKEWGEIGFQGTDPVTDLRGMGILGLRQLVHFARNQTVAARESLKLSYGDGSPLSGFPWAVTGINITSLLVDALNEHKLDEFLFECSVTFEKRFNDIYSSTFAQFAHDYIASNPKNIGDFPPFLKLFKSQLVERIAKYDVVKHDLMRTSSSANIDVDDDVVDDDNDLHVVDRS